MAKVKASRIIVDASQVIKTSEHDIKVVADEDTAGVFVDIYIDSQRVIEINAWNDGRLVFGKQAKKLKPRVRDEKTGKLEK